MVSQMGWPTVPSHRVRGLPVQAAGSRGVVKVLPHASLGACSALAAGDAVSDDVPRGAISHRSPPSMRRWGYSRLSRPVGNARTWAVRAAVFVPFATAARLLGWDCGDMVSPCAVWCWGQAAGHHAIALLQEELDAVATENTLPQEPLTAELAALPLALGADGVMVPFRPTSGAPTGKIRWCAITVGVRTRLHQHRTRRGHAVTRLQQRRRVAVLGPWRRVGPGCGAKPYARASCRPPTWSDSAMVAAG